MIESKNYVPKVCRDSRDFRALLKLLDIILANVKNDSKDFIKLLSPVSCPSHMLPMLASYVGYEYDYKVNLHANRLIIKYFPYMIRNRGSRTGISTAICVAINGMKEIDDTNLLNLFSIDYEKDTNKIKIYLNTKSYILKIYDLLEVVRPAGTFIEIVPSVPVHSQDTIAISDTIDIFKYDFAYGDLLVIGKNKYEIAFDRNGNIINVDDNGYILDIANGNIPTKYKIVNIDYEKDEKGDNTKKVNQILVKDVNSNEVIMAHTVRHGVDDRSRVGFSEIQTAMREYKGGIYEDKGYE